MLLPKRAAKETNLLFIIILSGIRKFDFFKLKFCSIACIVSGDYKVAWDVVVFRS